MERPGAQVAWQIWQDDRVYRQKAPWVSLINGHTRSSQDFQSIARSLARQGFRVLGMDNRGSGQSLVARAFTLEDIADDWCALWKELGVVSTHLAGISMGGLIARIIVSKSSEFIDSLSLIATMPDPSYLKHGNPGGWPEAHQDIMRNLSPYFSSEFYKRNKVLIRAMAKNIERAISEAGFNETAAQQRLAIEAFNSQQYPLPEALPKCQVIHSAEDRIVTEDAAKELVRLFKARLIVFAKTGHLILGEKPLELTALLAGFCQK